MTGIVIAALIALLAGAAIMVGARLSVRHAAPVATALLLGLAGYAWQGSPGQAGAPVEAGKERVQFDEALAEKRREIGERVSGATRWLVVSDGLARSGNTRDAANVLLAGLREFPDDANIWVGLGNALVAHSSGVLSPAADYAFRRALELEPEGVSPQYFYGLALAQEGEFERSRNMWLKLAADLPEDYPLREELVRNVVLLNALMERRDGVAPALPGRESAQGATPPDGPQAP